MARRGTVERSFNLDLAQHLADISRPPALGEGWQCEVAVELADDAALGGDFTVFGLDGSRLRVMLVDTSGKGAEAATRAVMLAGAVAGLLGELPAEQLLPAVNRHVQRVGSEENFATALLLEVDLDEGTFLLGNAGHPPAAHFLAGAGTWTLLEATGPALGFLPDATWSFHQGQLALDDVLLAVTDGVVEVAGTDLDVGFDRFLGQANNLVLHGWVNGARELLDQRRGAGTDDAQVLLLRRVGR